MERLLGRFVQEDKRGGRLTSARQIDLQLNQRTHMAVGRYVHWTFKDCVVRGAGFGRPNLPTAASFDERSVKSRRIAIHHICRPGLTGRPGQLILHPK